MPRCLYLCYHGCITCGLDVKRDGLETQITGSISRSTCALLSWRRTGMMMLQYDERDVRAIQRRTGSPRWHMLYCAFYGVMSCAVCMVV